MSSVFVYRAALLCEPCGERTRDELAAKGLAPADPDNESSYDSDAYPKGPYPDGGGESDSPSHCDVCSEFLENPLTSHGRQYVRDASPRTATVRAWQDYYGITPEPVTPVIYRRFTDTGTPIALFPTLPGSGPGTCESYMRLGQHGAASVELTSGPDTRAASMADAEIADLHAHLGRLGYRLRVVSRRSAAMDRVRMDTV